MVEPQLRWLSRYQGLCAGDWILSEINSSGNERSMEDLAVFVRSRLEYFAAKWVATYQQDFSGCSLALLRRSSVGDQVEYLWLDHVSYSFVNLHWTFAYHDDQARQSTPPRMRCVLVCSALCV